MDESKGKPLKRKLNKTEENQEKSNSHQKVQINEGFSWWNCLQYNIPLEKSKPYAVKKIEEQ